MSKPRNLIEVIDAAVAIVPELEGPLARVRRSVGFTAPEIMTWRWQEATEIVAALVPRTHPKHAEVQAVWNDAPRLSLETLTHLASGPEAVCTAAEQVAMAREVIDLRACLAAARAVGVETMRARAIDIINEMREDGEGDLRSARDRIRLAKVSS